MEPRFVDLERKKRRHHWRERERKGRARSIREEREKGKADGRASFWTTKLGFRVQHAGTIRRNQWDLGLGKTNGYLFILGENTGFGWKTGLAILKSVATQLLPAEKSYAAPSPLLYLPGGAPPLLALLCWECICLAAASFRLLAGAARSYWVASLFWNELTAASRRTHRLPHSGGAGHLSPSLGPGL